MGGTLTPTDSISFKKKVVESFKKIKDDYDRLVLDTDYKTGNLNTRLTYIESNFNILNLKIDQLINSIKNIEKEITKSTRNRTSAKQPPTKENKKDNPPVSDGTSSKNTPIGREIFKHYKQSPTEGQVPKGKSSKRNIANSDHYETTNDKQENPLVSSGTSPTNTKRANKTKEKILQFNNNYLKEIYNKIVIEQELCSKTTFYRFIKELNKENKITITLEGNQRKIQTNRNI